MGKKKPAENMAIGILFFTKEVTERLHRRGELQSGMLGVRISDHFKGNHPQNC